MNREKVGQWIQVMQSQYEEKYSTSSGQEGLYAKYAYMCGRLESMLVDALLTDTGRQFVIDMIEEDLQSSRSAGT